MSEDQFWAPTAERRRRISHFNCKAYMNHLQNEKYGLRCSGVDSILFCCSLSLFSHLTFRPGGWKISLASQCTECMMAVGRADETICSFPTPFTSHFLSNPIPSFSYINKVQSFFFFVCFFTGVLKQVNISIHHGKMPFDILTVSCEHASQHWQPIYSSFPQPYSHHRHQSSIIIISSFCYYHAFFLM